MISRQPAWNSSTARGSRSMRDTNCWWRRFPWSTMREAGRCRQSPWLRAGRGAADRVPAMGPGASLGNQRERLRKTYQLGEEILGAAPRKRFSSVWRSAARHSADDARPPVCPQSRALRHWTRCWMNGGAGASISLSAPPAGTQPGAVACFHYRTLLAIPDIDRSPFPIGGKPGDAAPKIAAFRSHAGAGRSGWGAGTGPGRPGTRLYGRRAGAGAAPGQSDRGAIRLLDQRSVQEQLFRTEKLAAVGRLISGVVSELQTPLASISDLAHRALEKSPRDAGGAGSGGHRRGSA